MRDPECGSGSLGFHSAAVVRISTEEGFLSADEAIETVRGLEAKAVQLQHTIKSVIREGESQCVGECLEIPVVSQGQTLDEAVRNLQEAVALHLDGEDLGALGLADNPTLVVTMEVEPGYAKAEAAVG